VVDGNVFRVLSRLFASDTPIDTGRGKKEFTELAGSIMNPVKAGLHNQAIMEFGALQCVPKNPDCATCPLAVKCLAYAKGIPLFYPIKQNKTKTRNRYFNYLHILCNGETWLNRRSSDDIWKSLYELPLIETEKETDFVSLQKTEAFQQVFDNVGELTISKKLPHVKHVLSHQIIYATFYKVEIERPSVQLNSYIKIPDNSIGNYAVPRLIQIYFEKD